jgi:hypothetical protein
VARHRFPMARLDGPSVTRRVKPRLSKAASSCRTPNFHSHQAVVIIYYHSPTFTLSFGAPAT